MRARRCCSGASVSLLYNWLHFFACQLQNLETEVRPYLSRWYEESVMHIHRVVQLAQSNISVLLHAVSPVRPLQFVPIQNVVSIILFTLLGSESHAGRGQELGWENKGWRVQVSFILYDLMFPFLIVRVFTCLFSTRFIKAASLQGLSQQDTSAASLCTATSEDTHTDLIIDCSTSPPTLLNAGNLGY